MIDIDNILEFTKFLNEFQKIERMIFVRGLDRNENDQEHSYSLAMLAWYINSTSELGLDSEKLMKYALAHDLVEVYAGDTYFYQKDGNTAETKKQKEHEAFLDIQKRFSEFPELLQIIDAYERREDEESRFVYALDKIEPILKIYLDNGRSWKRDGVTLAMAKEMKIPKVKEHPEIEKYFFQLLTYLESGEKDLFFQK